MTTDDLQQVVNALVEGFSDSGSKSVPMATTDADEVIRSQLQENTGRHLLDSGGAYGRNWEENQDNPPWEQPEWNVDDSFVTHNVYHYLKQRATRDSGAVAIYTPGGAALLDGKAAQLGFARSNVVAPHMTLENGLLSGLEINGIPVRTDGARSPVAGGGLAALFEARDGVAPAAQARIDGLARDLVERFQQPGLDSTRAPGQPGLFTDMQAVFDPADEIGISGRIALNTAVDEAAEGAVWRLRDGLGADTPANAGDATLLQVLSDSLSRPAPPASAALDAGPVSLAAHIGAVTSSMGQARLSAEQDLGFANSVQAGLKESELAQGVDTDEQLQRLLLVEQAYAANARMIQTMEDLLDTLIRI